MLYGDAVCVLMLCVMLCVMLCSGMIDFMLFGGFVTDEQTDGRTFAVVESLLRLKTGGPLRILSLENNTCLKKLGMIQEKNCNLRPSNFH